MKPRSVNNNVFPPLFIAYIAATYDGVDLLAIIDE
jgi:hypothetical protein